MSALLKVECKKAFCSKWFLISLILGFLCAGICAYHAYDNFSNTLETLLYYKENELIIREGWESTFLYNSWLSAIKEFGSVLFFHLAPLLAVLPCGWSISEELNSGYIKVLVPRVGRKKYYLSKMMVSFLSGGIVISFPLLLSLGITASFMPAIKPEPFHDIYYSVLHNDMMSALAYNDPFLYALVYIGIAFLFGGCFASLSIIVALRSEKRIAALIIPYLFILLCDSARNFLNYICFIEISPLNLMQAIPPMNITKSYVVLAWILFFIISIYCFGYRTGVKKEIV